VRLGSFAGNVAVSGGARLIRKHIVDNSIIVKARELPDRSVELRTLDPQAHCTSQTSENGNRVVLRRLAEEAGNSGYPMENVQHCSERGRMGNLAKQK
jgi:hypothetical protein